MDDLNAKLLQFNQNLAILREREAKYAGNAPVSLLNQITDYQTAIDLVEQTRAGRLTPAALAKGLAPLNLELPPVLALPPLAPALRQLPAPPADFTGREAELAELVAALEQGGATISGLRGLGGIGKTALALKLAERLAPGYPDAQFFIELRGTDPDPLPAAAALAQVIRAYHPTARLPEGEADLRGLYRSVLHGQKALLVLDNAAGPAQVKPLLPPPGCAVLITSRQHFHLPGLYPKDLNTLPPADARRLLVKIAPRLAASPPAIGPHPQPLSQFGRGAEGEEPADSLARLCGYLPLALRLAASALAERPDLSLAEYLRRLSEAQQRLARLDAAREWTDLPYGVAASLGLSFELLTPEWQKLWAALVVFPADFDRPAAAAVWELAPDPAEDRLGDLLRYSLVESEPGRDGGEGRYRLHDLARLFAAARLAPAARAEAEQRHAGYYLSIFWEIDKLYKQKDAILHGLALFDREWVNIQAGQAWAATHAETNETAARLGHDYPNAGAYLLNLRQHPRERIRWREVALAAARRRQDRGMEGAHLGNLGLAYAGLGESRRAIEYHEQALVIDREIGHRRGEGNTLGNLGNAYADLGESRRAIEYHEQYLTIAREIGDRRGEGNALGSLGLAYATLGESRPAIEYHEQYLTIAREIGDRRGEGNALGNLGLAYAGLGESRRAIEYYEQDLVIAREIGDRRGEGNARWNMAWALDQLGERARAIACGEAALQIFEQLESPHTEMVRAQLAQWRGE